MTKFPKSTKTLKERRAILKDYIISSINWDGYDIDEPITNKDKLLFVLNNFKQEKKHEFKIYGYSRSFKEHLQGLPSYLNVDFEYYKIKKVFNKLGYTERTEKQEDNMLLNWWDYMRTAFFYLCRKEGINLYEVLKNEL